jgi:hypothetical protein
MRILQGGVLLAAALVFSAGCGSSGGKAAARPSGSASASGGFAAYTACLRQHGVNIPTARPSGGAGGGGFFGGGAAGGANQQARQACQSLAPRGGFGGRGMQEMQAFRSCLSDHGVTLPTPSPGAARTPGARPSPGARRTPGEGLLGRFDTSDPKVAKAVKTCRPLLPSFSPRPSPS